ncbi:MAG: response regulator [bacterium]
MSLSVDGFRRGWFALVDRVLPPRLRDADPESLRKARLLVSFWLAMEAWVPPLLILLPLLGMGWVVSVLLVSAVAGFVTPTLLRRTASVTIAGNYFTACLFAFVTYFALRSGGLFSPALLWHPVVIMAAMTLVGTRSAVAWTAVCVAQVLWLLSAGGTTHSTMPALSPAGMRVFLVLGLVSLDGLVLFLSQVYESYKNAAVTALQEARSETERARLRAEDASRAKSQFLANMSHEIRTPLNAVLGMTSLLLDTRLDTAQRDYVETAHASGEHLLTVINDILDFSKIEAGRLDLERTAFAIRECVEEALDVVAFGATKKGIELNALVEPGVPTAIEGDAGRVRQVLVNLLSNAVKFTERGEVMLHVDVERAERGGVYELRFVVHDTGIGIAPEHRDRIFAVFSQVDASSTRRYGGSGLGLAISKRLVEMMGGRIWFESTPGQGSMFAFTVRAPKAEGATERLDRSHLPVLAGKRALIVDDNETNRRVMHAFTAAMGMVPHALGSPLAALAWIEGGGELDVAILDFQMPEMDGAELARRIRGLPGRARLPIVLATSSLGHSAQESATRAPGFTAYLMKPVKRSQLEVLLVRVLAAPQGEPEAVTPDDPVNLDPQPARASTAPLDPSPASAGDAERVPAMRVLLVEDNAMNQKVALAMLARLGLTADLAADGREAIAALAAKPYDVVLMDIQMPVMDGFTAARVICHRWKPAERPRLIAMTANAMSGDEERCRQAGMDDYISKPVRLDELAAALRRNAPPSGTTTPSPT